MNSFTSSLLSSQVVSVCKKCVAPKPPRAHHCSVCDRCVLKGPYLNDVRLQNIQSFSMPLSSSTFHISCSHCSSTKMSWTSFECVITIKMDHHCPWLDGCVGHRNHRHFFLYMVFTVAGCLFVMLFGFEVGTRNLKQSQATNAAAVSPRIQSLESESGT